MVTYPKAVGLARTMNLERFMVPCPSTKELYGYSSFVLDHKKAQGFLARELKLPYSHEGVIDALMVLEARVSAITNP